MYSSYSEVLDMIVIMRIITVCIAIYSLVVRVFMAQKFAEVAEEKGHGKGFFWIVIFCGLLGMLYIIALPDRNRYSVTLQEKENDYASDDDCLPEL